MQVQGEYPTCQGKCYCVPCKSQSVSAWGRGRTKAFPTGEAAPLEYLRFGYRPSGIATLPQALGPGTAPSRRQDVISPCHSAALQDSKQQDAAAAAAAAHPKLPATPHPAAVKLGSITPLVLGPAMPIRLAPLTSLQVMLCPYSRAPAGWGWLLEAQCWVLRWQLGERESYFFRRKIKVFSFKMYICN